MKTINQAAKEYSAFEINEGNENDALFSSRSGMKQLVERSFKSGIEFAQRWIPVEEELPEILTDILIKQSNGKVAIGCKMRHGFNVEITNRKINVTHWRPIELK